MKGKLHVLCLFGVQILFLQNFAKSWIAKKKLIWSFSVNVLEKRLASGLTSCAKRNLRLSMCWHEVRAVHTTV